MFDRFVNMVLNCNKKAPYIITFRLHADLFLVGMYNIHFDYCYCPVCTCAASKGLPNFNQVTRDILKNSFSVIFKIGRVVQKTVKMARPWLFINGFGIKNK